MSYTGYIQILCYYECIPAASSRIKGNQIVSENTLITKIQIDSRKFPL